MASHLILAILLVLAGAYTIAVAVRTDLPWSRRRVAAMTLCRLGILTAVGAWCFDLNLRFHTRSDRVELLVLADHSASIAPQGLQAVNQWVERAERAARQSGNFVLTREIAADGGRATPIAEALAAARRLFPRRGEKRVLLLSDGRATSGDPRAEIPRLQQDAIKVYAVPAIPLTGESLVADFNVPAAAWRCVPVPAEATLQAAAAGPCLVTLAVDGRPSARRQLKLAAGARSSRCPWSFPATAFTRSSLRRGSPKIGWIGTIARPRWSTCRWRRG